MPEALPIDWSETEKACLAGVPIRQVANAMADKAGLNRERVYVAIRKRISRERWPLPDAIIRRAKAQARVAAGVAKDAKEAAEWRKGDVVLEQIKESREAVGMGVPQDCVELLSRDAQEEAENAIESGGLGARGALPAVLPTAAELVTASLQERGSTGLSLALDAALASLRSLDPAAPVPIRSMTDLLTAVKATQAAAGLDKPQVAVAVSLNSSGNATVAAWESA